MKDHTCPLRPPPKISLRHDHNWTRGNDQLGLQLNISQSENSFNSLLEKHHVLNSPNQPNPNPIQSVIDRGNLRTQNVFLWIKGKRPVHKRSMINVCTKNLALQIKQGNLRKLSENIRVKRAHVGTGEPVKSSASTHIVKEQFVPAEHRDIASSTVQPTRRTLTSTFQECQIRQ